MSKIQYERLTSKDRPSHSGDGKILTLYKTPRSYQMSHQPTNDFINRTATPSTTITRKAIDVSDFEFKHRRRQWRKQQQQQLPLLRLRLQQQVGDAARPRSCTLTNQSICLSARPLLTRHAIPLIDSHFWMWYEKKTLTCRRVRDHGERGSGLLSAADRNRRSRTAVDRSPTRKSPPGVAPQPRSQHGPWPTHVYRELSQVFAGPEAEQWQRRPQREMRTVNERAVAYLTERRD